MFNIFNAACFITVIEHGRFMLFEFLIFFLLFQCVLFFFSCRGLMHQSRHGLGIDLNFKKIFFHA